MAIPNYLGFLKEYPEKSPLERGIEGFTTGYGEMLELHKKTREEQEKKMEMKYLPEKLEQQAKVRKLLLESMPQDIRLRQTKESLENTHQEITNQMKKMDINALNQQLIDAEMTKLYDVHINHPELEVEQIKASRHLLSGYQIDPAIIPEKPDDKFWGMTGMVAVRSPEAAATQKYKQGVAKSIIEGQLKIDAVKAKKSNTIQDKIDEQRATIGVKWAEETLPAEVEGANKIEDNMNTILQNLHEHRLAHGIVAHIPGMQYFFPAISQSTMSALDTVIKQLAQTPGASRGTKALLDTIKAAKVSPTDPPEAIEKKAMMIKTGAAMVREEQRFAALMNQHGIYVKSQIEGAWDRFLENKTYIDKAGNYNPERVKDWTVYFQAHPEDLPHGLVKSMKEQQAYQQSVGAPESVTAPVTAPVVGTNLPLTQKQQARLGQVFPGAQQMTTEQAQRAVEITTPWNVFQKAQQTSYLTDTGLIPDLNQTLIG